jgi:squalene-hopene/tetraprenyl-beta-curcumene cyclase
MLDDANSGIARAVQFLERAHQTGYAEAVHRLPFPRWRGFTGADDWLTGCVFQRAIICDALLDAQSIGLEIDQRCLDEDVATLMAERATDVRGGWRYIPGVPELPPDTDDLAAVLQVLVRTDTRLAEVCDDAIQLLFDQNAFPDGSCETYIVDWQDEREVTRRMARGIETGLGKGPDPEVVANLLYALWLYNPARYAERIARGVDYLLGQQAADGYWESNNYHGPYYGTFVASRIISLYRPEAPALSRAASFVLAGQAPDSGWGQPDSIPIDTALALLSLSYLAAASVAVPARSVEAGLDFLLAAQQEDGSWPATIFMEWDGNRASVQAGRGKPLLLSYKSRTIATAYCLKALCQTT